MSLTISSPAVLPSLVPRVDVSLVSTYTDIRSQIDPLRGGRAEREAPEKANMLNKQSNADRRELGSASCSFCYESNQRLQTKQRSHDELIFWSFFSWDDMGLTLTGTAMPLWG